MGVSYVSIFTVCYHVCFWVGGGAHSLSWDYLPGVPQGEEAERHVSWKEKPIGGLIARYILRLPSTPPPPLVIDYVKKDEEDPYYEKEAKVAVEVLDAPVSNIPKVVISDETEPDSDIQLARRTSRMSAVSTFRSRRLPGSVPPSPLRVTMPSSPLRVTIPASSLKTSVPSSPLRAGPPPTPLRTVVVASPTHSSASSDTVAEPTKNIDTPLPTKHWLHVVFHPLMALVKPVTIAIAVALPVALITPLKALFVDVSAQGGPTWHGPDGRPPLVFVMDTGESQDQIGTNAS